MRPRLIACDLDGTVVKNGTEITKRTAHAFKRAHELGCVTAISTGRSESMVSSQLRSALGADYLISSNGARLSELGSGAVLLSRPLARSTAREIMLSQKRDGAAFSIQFENTSVLEWRTVAGWLRTEHSREKFSLGSFIGLISSVHCVISAQRQLERRRDEVEKLSIFIEDARALEQRRDEVLSGFEVSAVCASAHELEITAAQVSKGEALRALAQRLGIEKEEIIAFGDSGNDVSMAQAAGLFVAMENADELAKAAAHDIARSIENDGVAEYLEALWNKEGI